MSPFTIASLLAELTNASGLPVLELRMLLMYGLNKTRIQLITQSDAALTGQQCDCVQALVARRQQGEPIAYILGQREFFGLMLKVTTDVLIPRPDTELLVELALQLTPANAALLDLGTGSGAIAVAVAHQRPDLQVSAADISAAALEVARTNAALHVCRIAFFHSDWYAGIPQAQWQTIVSNPPYIVLDDAHLSQGDLRFEPIDALTDHADGLSAYRQIIQGAVSRLNGWLLMEHGYDQAAAVRELLRQHGFSEIQSWRDLAGIERVSGGVLSSATQRRSAVQTGG